MRLSIITTMYYSAPYIEEFYRRSTAAAKQITGDYEIVIVNDGSPDNAVDVAIRLHREDPKVKVIDLSRNFGHHKAMLCGLAHATGDEVFLIDCDLEESPEWVVEFHQQMSVEGCDVVYGVQARRKGHVFERYSGAAFYALVDHLGDFETTPNRTSAILMKRDYVRALNLFVEREPVFLGLSLLAGFDQRPRTVTKTSKDTTTYTLSRKIATTVNMITAFSSKPLIYIFYVGMLIFVCSVAYSSWLLVNRLFFEKPLEGWTSVIMSIWVLGGMIISFVGVVGIYVSRIFVETKQRPNVIVKRLFDSAES